MRRHPAAMSTRFTLLCAPLCVLLLCVGARIVAADRPARVITPEGSPLWLDPQRSFFFDSPAVAVMLRNEHTEPVKYALRIWIFDERARLKGTLDRCTYDELGRNSRGRVLIPIEIPGVTLRDRAIVSVTAVASGRVAWKLRQTEAEQLDTAFAVSKDLPGRLSLDRYDAGPSDWSCPCECSTIQAACDRRCAATAPTASTCTRTFDSGCSATCSCKSSR
jgi:hypothetical protein